MKKLILKTNEEYFNFINRYREQLTVYEVYYTKTGKIRIFYDII